ncbi:hypothetical protein EF294_02515 [Gordonia oryzae]|uniref:Uncharacterized protein n=1 Tax=Gordonia oryzae TaxID=2487349 RepID=A0A3N4GXT0_9ACTN|nr:hypothetical protein [Gordonia oryzae]RPA65648.1 hypothetical protein EF294_02515 [Gordonia oryzae]
MTAPQPQRRRAGWLVLAVAVIGIAVLAGALVALGIADRDGARVEVSSEVATTPALGPGIKLAPERGPANPEAATPPSISTLCAAYGRARSVTVEADGTPGPIPGALRNLAALARNYPDSGVQSDAPQLELVATRGYTYPRDFYGATLNIGRACGY